MGILSGKLVAVEEDNHWEAKSEIRMSKFETMKKSENGK